MARLRAFLDGGDDAAKLFGISVDALKFGLAQVIGILEQAESSLGELARLVGGTVNSTSILGEGTEIRVNLPMTDAMGIDAD